jgi:ketosteroid isomerase-like protein
MKTDVKTEAGTVALASMDSLLKVRVQGRDMTLPMRASSVFGKRKEKWPIMHSHFFAPASGQQQGRSF